MILTEALSPACVKVPLEGTDKDSIITELVDLLHENGVLTDRDHVLEEVFDRERIRSTGIGCGIAIPHGRSTSIHDLVMAVGIAPTPVDFDSVDGSPVSTVVLLVSPVGRTGPHIQALARIGRIMVNAEFRETLAAATSAQAAYELLIAADQAGADHEQRQLAAIA